MHVSNDIVWMIRSTVFMFLKAALILALSILFSWLFARETLLGQLMVHVRQISEDFSIRTGHRGGKGVPKGKNLPDVVNNIVYVRQLEAKVCVCVCLLNFLFICGDAIMLSFSFQLLYIYLGVYKP